MPPRLRKNASSRSISDAADRAVEPDAHRVAERRSGADEDGAAAGHIERGGLRMDGGAAARVGRFGGFNPPRQRQIGKNQEIPLSQYAAWRII